jgi:hypothetical protein
MNTLDHTTQPTEAHRKLWTALYNLAHREIFEDYAESSDGPATQLIADSEALAVERALTAELTRLRAEVERWKTVAAQMSEEREHNANEAALSRAEVKRLDWLEENWTRWPIARQADTIRAAIDAAMKGTP